MRLRDRLLIEIAVQRVAWWLDWQHMPGRRRREIVRELRANLADAARAAELAGALERIGEPRAMADAYLENEGTGVRWRAGVLSAAFVYAGVTWLVLAFMFGFAEGVQAVGPEVGRTYETGRGLVIGDGPLTSFVLTDGQLHASGALLTWLHLAAALVTFVVFARPWRSVRARTRVHQPG